jgi:hypothetical protein
MLAMVGAPPERMVVSRSPNGTARTETFTPGCLAV